MLNLITRKSFSAILTFIISLGILWIIFYNPFDGSFILYISILVVGLILGPLLSVVIEIFLRKTTLNSFALRLTLHILAACILQFIFLPFAPMFLFAFLIVIPVAIIFFLIDELLKWKFKIFT